MPNYLFKRTAKLIIGTEDNEALSFGDDFRMSFDVQKNRTSLPNIGVFQLWNLSEDTRNKLADVINGNLERLQKKETPLPLIFYAGYADGDGLVLLFNGYITRSISLVQPPEIITRIECGDGALPLSNNTIATSFAAGIDSNTIIKNIAANMGLAISGASNYLDSKMTFAHGEAFTGLSKKFMDKITKAAGLDWHVNDNQIVLIKKNQSTKQTAVLVSAETGMIKSPEKTDTAVATQTQTLSQQGWSFTTLLEPDITPGRKVQIDSKVVKGDFIVGSVDHKGDNWQGDWSTSVQTDVSGF